MCLRTRDFTKTLSLKSVHILNRQRHFTSSHATTGGKKDLLKAKHLDFREKSSKNLFEGSINNFKSHLRVRGYPDNLVKSCTRINALLRGARL